MDPNDERVTGYPDPITGKKVHGARPAKFVMPVWYRKIDHKYDNFLSELSDVLDNLKDDSVSDADFIKVVRHRLGEDIGDALEAWLEDEKH